MQFVIVLGRLLPAILVTTLLLFTTTTALAEAIASDKDKIAITNEGKKLKGNVDGVVPGGNEFILEGRRIHIVPRTVFIEGSAADIDLGVYVEVKGATRTDGGIEAVEIKFKAEYDIIVDDEDIPVSGGGTKGPLAFAQVSSYIFDGGSAATDYQGAISDTGETDEASKIIGLRFPKYPEPAYIVEVSADSDTIDITTGQYPVITAMRTVITRDALFGINRNQPQRELYATPLTTLAVDIAVANLKAAGSSVVTPEEFLTALDEAETLVVNTLGFGMDANIDIFSTPPLVNSTTTSPEDQQAIAEYRTAIEAVTAIAYQIAELSGDSGLTTDDMVSALAEDLADGVIDGSVDGEPIGDYGSESLVVFEQDPATLPIPNSTLTVGDVADIVVAETTATGETAPEPEPEPVQSDPAETNPDRDGDGVPNSEDAFPDDPNLSSFDDADGDGWPVGQDNDDTDKFVPGIPFVDTDGDGFADEGGLNPDTDDDNDGLSDFDELNGAVITDPLRRDTDGDGALDGADLFPVDPTAAFDSDNDGIPNSVRAGEIVLTTATGRGADTYITRQYPGGNGEGVQPSMLLRNDRRNVWPYDAGFTRHAYLKFDLNGINSTAKLSGARLDFTLLDSFLIPGFEYEQNYPWFWVIEFHALRDELDADGWGETGISWSNAPGKRNADSIYFNSEMQPMGLVSTQGRGRGSQVSFASSGLDAAIQADTDGFLTIALRRANETRTDTSGQIATKENGQFPPPRLVLQTGNTQDNCPLIANPGQEDLDGDGFGDVCDSDIDGDGVANGADAFPTDPDESVDTDGDGVGNNEDTDDDNDGIPDADEIANGTDPLKADTDGDGVNDAEDAFPTNPDESVDTDNDGIGDNADPDDDNDGVEDLLDAFPNDPNESVDADGDGVGANSDLNDTDGSVGAASTFTAANLAPAYINLFEGTNSDPTRDLFTQFNEPTVRFDTGTGRGSRVSLWAEDEFSFTLVDNVLRLTWDAPEAPEQDTDTVSELIALGVVDPELGNAYIDANGDNPVTTTFQVTDIEFRLLEDGTAEDRFWITDIVSYSIGDPIVSEALLGSAGAVVSGIARRSEAVALDDVSALPVIAWTDAELMGNDFAMSVVFDARWNIPLVDDIATFDDDFSATTQVLGQSFSWSIDQGVLVVDYGDGRVIRVQRFESYNDSFGLYTTGTDGVINRAGYRFGAPATGQVNIAGMQDRILANAPTVTSPITVLFGFNLNSNGRAQRVFLNEPFDSTQAGAGWDDMFWSQDASGRIDLERRLEAGGSSWAACNSQADNCNVFLVRRWQPLAIAGNRLYMLEWRDLNANFRDFPSQPENFVPNFPPRVTFYELADFDWDGDGTFDHLDNDIDGDGVLNGDDLFPFDVNESTDFDGDNVGDNEDSDADNDGVPNSEDAFPLDASEQTDADGDGVGANTDLNDNDARVGVALSFAGGELDSSYVFLNTGALIDPSRRLSSGSGMAYTFDGQGAGYFAGIESGTSFTYSVAGDVMERIPANSVGVTYIVPQAMVDLGLIDQAAADNHVNTYGNYQVGLQFQVVSDTWQLLADNEPQDDGTIVDRFYVTSTSDYQVANDWERASLFGDVNAVARRATSAPDVLALTIRDSLPVSSFTAADFAGGAAYATRMLFNPDERVGFRFASDIVDLTPTGDGTAGTGTSRVHGQDVDWNLDGGTLNFSYPDPDGEGTIVVNVQRFETYSGAEGTIVSTSDPDTGEQLSQYTVSATVDAVASFAGLENQFLQNSFSLTNPDSYDEFGNVVPFAYFGYRIEPNGRSTRIYSGDFDQNNYGAGWDTWFHSTDANGVISIVARRSQDAGTYAVCGDQEPTCNNWRYRRWAPLSRVGDRIYVLEWEDRNAQSGSYPSQPEALWRAMTPRIQFYEVLDVDWDRDGTFDSGDSDWDGDGTPNDQDGVPFDPNETADSDADGIGDNADVDTDSDGDGVPDGQDAFPDDPNESVDADGDGVGANSDLNDNDPGVGAALSLVGSELQSSYVYLSTGALDDPSRRTGSGSGMAYTFNNDGTGYLAGLESGSPFTYTIANGVLERVPENNVGVTYIRVQEMVNLGLIAQQTANDFLASNQDYQIGLELRVLADSWQLLADDELQDDGTLMDRFYSTTTTEYHVIGDYERELLYGDINAAPRSVTGAPEVLFLAHRDSLPSITFEAGEFAGGAAYATRMVFNPEERVGYRFASDIVDLTPTGDGTAGTGTSRVYGQSVTWNLDGGTLNIFYAHPNNQGGTIEVNIQRFETYTGAEGAITTATDPDTGEQLSQYAVSAIVESDASFAGLENQFLQNSFSLTNPDSYDEFGNVVPFAYFGYRIEPNGRATRIYDGNFDQYNFGAGWDTWFHSTDANGVLSFVAREKQDSGLHIACGDQEPTCNNWRYRRWAPLSRVGDRIYVLEWEDRNAQAFSYPSQPETYWRAMNPRIQFYEVLEVNSDGEGLPDSQDDDWDNDGVTNDVDEVPFDPYESEDTDADGIGDNADTDWDNDGATNDVDPEPYNAAVAGRWSEVAGLDVALMACINEQVSANGWEFKFQVEYLDCNGRPIGDLTGIGQLDGIRGLGLNNILATNFRPVADISSLRSFDAHENTSFDNEDLAAFEGHPSLFWLGINNSSVTDITPLSTIASFEQLSIYGQNVVNLSPLVTAPGFNALYIDRNQVPDFTVLGGQDGLNLLTLHLSGEVETGDVDFLATNLTGLISFAWNFNTTFTTADFNRIVEVNPNLESIGLTRNAVTDISVLLSFADGLTWLDMGDGNVPDLSPLYGKPNLESVWVGGAGLYDFSQIDVLRNDYGVDVQGDPIQAQTFASIDFTDVDLEACVSANYPGIEVNTQLTWLNCGGIAAIDDLTGLESFPRLDGIIIDDTSVTDLSPILDLPSLGYLSVVGLTLDQNQVNYLRGRGVDVAE